MTGDDQVTRPTPQFGRFSVFLGRLEAEVGLILMHLGALATLFVVPYLIASMYFYDQPKLAPMPRLGLSIALLFVIAGELYSAAWLNSRMKLAIYPQPVSVAASLTVRWWPFRLMLSAWWLAQVCAAFWLTDIVLGEQGKLQPVTTGEWMLKYSTRGFVVFFASYVMTVNVLLALGSAGFGRAWLTRIYHARLLIDAVIAVIGSFMFETMR